MTGTGKPLSVDTGIRFPNPNPGLRIWIQGLVREQSPLQTPVSRVLFPPVSTPLRLTYLAPQSPQEKLEKFFNSRPSPTELKQRNILKDSNVAPALQSAQAQDPKISLGLTIAGGITKKKA